MRADRGDGRNVFGYRIDDVVAVTYKDYPFPNEVEEDFNGSFSKGGKKWCELTDAECQELRNRYSIYRDNTGLLDTLDYLSNRYLGTKGKSFGSYNEKKGCYTGGIFTGAKTSANHEIWERYIAITDACFKENYNKDFSFSTWSYPGNPHSPFVYENDSRYYYDLENKVLYNYLARFKSSITGENRSWTDCLRNNGYLLTHDTFYPSRQDGQKMCMMRTQLIKNASLSRPDALIYPTDRTINYDNIRDAYPKTFFDDNSNLTNAEQMYEAESEFYDFIEKLRHDNSNGIIHGEVIDSLDTYSERVFLNEILNFCDRAGISVITKKEAYGLCFDKIIEDGNLVYNPNFENSISEYLPDVKNMPKNPDGYQGNCEVLDEKTPTLKIEGEAFYLHCGIPTGSLEYKANVKGKGTISIYSVKNNDTYELNDKELELLEHIKIDDEDFNSKTISFSVDNNPLTEYEQLCGGWGEKIMGIKIVYNGNIEIKDIELRKVK